MPRFLLWNMDAAHDIAEDRRAFERLLAGLALANDIDILLLVECSIPTDRILEHLPARPSYNAISGPDRFRVFARFPAEYMTPLDAPLLSDRIGLWHLTLPLQDSAIVSLVHGLDRRNNTCAMRELFLNQVVSRISWVERKLGHQRTVVAGDFNANPFEPELGSALGMNAVMTRDLAMAKPRRVQGREFGYFYNPMWSLFGDAREGQPPGTYFFNGRQPHEWYWHMLDQVLVRPALIPRFPLASLNIVSRGPNGELATPRGRPDRGNGSDHFPISFELDLRPL